ncbi:MAG: PAS domain S-box protein [Verrucomicrobia bacterium]|nr:PAS domain S-box protein [Cytophagales bacterium]
MKNQQSLQLLQLSLDHCSEAVGWFNSHGELFLQNQPFLELFGINPKTNDEFSFQSLALLFNSANFLTWKAFLDRCRKQNKITEEIYFIKGKKTVHFKVQVFYQFVEEQELLCMVFTDQTQDNQIKKLKTRIHRIINKVIIDYPIMVFAMDKSGKIQIWNDRSEQITGFMGSEVIGQSGSRFFARYTLDYIEKLMQTKPKDNQNVHQPLLEIPFSCKDGSVKYLYWTLRYNSQLAPNACIWGLGIDLTEKVKAQQALLESEQRFYTVSKATNDAIWDWNLVNNELVWNDGINELFGYPPDEIENKIAWWEANIYEEDRERVVTRIQKFIDQGEHYWSDEYRFLRRDGSMAFVYDKGSIIRDHENKPIRMIGGIMDITDRKIFEQNLILRNRQLSEFAFFNSHRLRSPLTRLMGLVYLLDSEDLNVEKEHKELLKHIYTAAEELDRLTRDMAKLLV